MSISKNQFYGDNGFYIFNQPVVDNKKIEIARLGIDMIRDGKYDTGNPPEKSPWNPGDDQNILCKIEQPQIASNGIKKLIHSSEIGKLAAQTLNAKMIQVWWVQLLYKPPADTNISANTKVGWHQDWTYWKNDWEAGSELATVWIALSNVNEASGPMKFINGSHQWGEISGGDFFSQSNSKEDFKLSGDKHWQESLGIMEPGEMSIHHKLVLHGSSFNISKEPRCSLAIHIRTEKSNLINRKRAGLGKYINNSEINPIIFSN